MGAAIIAPPLLAIAGGGYLAVRHLGAEQMDEHACYIRPDQETHAVFVDFSLTRDLSASQGRDLRNMLDQAFDGLGPNGRIAVFTTASESTATVMEPEFVLCKTARRPAELERIGAPSSSPQRLARQHEEVEARWQAQVDDLVARAADADHGAQSSPILEQMQGLSHHRFPAPLTRLTVFTDGINNSATAQFCAVKGDLPSFARFAERADYRFVAPENFGGASVDVLLVEGRILPSPGLEFCTNHELRDFWSAYFEANGAGRVRLTPLGYGAGQ